ncbi:MAG: monovalent cation:proton antiporter-2 (CPA2) family protein [Rickettsiales bacterium]|nr:monovalent cation:proton antiporter-2 (CPA2) family protein [Rickettsiales bacterium]
MQNGLFEVFVFLAAACVIVPLSSRLKLGSVLGYLAAGIVIGPYVLGFITEADKVMHFAEFGVVMMLFVIGLELEPAALWRLRKSILGMGGLQVSLTSATFTMIGVGIGYSWQVSLAAGLALSLSSTALVLQMLNEKNLMNTSVGESSFSILLFQDIAVIPILVLLPVLAMHSAPAVGAQASMIAQLPGYAQALVVAGVIALVILGGRYLSHHLFQAIARSKLREIFTALSLALVVGITLLMQWIGMSPALGAFVAGVVLANSEYRRTLETDIEPFKGLLLGLFFISVGMGIDFSLFGRLPLMISSAVVVLMLVKAIILWGLGRLFGLSAIHNLGYALALSQGGEFAFVLFQFSGGLSLLKPSQVNFLTLVVALSIAATPLLMLWYQRMIVPRFMSVLPVRDFDKVTEMRPVIIAGFGRFGQVIGRFLVGQGIDVTVVEKDPDQIDLIRKFGFKGFYGDATRLDLLHSVGAAKAQLLIVAVDDVAASLEIVRLAKEEFPSLTIFARARNRQHAYDLHVLGVHYFKRELFDASLNMAKHIMIWLGKPEAEVLRKAEQFYQHDEETLKESFKFFGDDKTLVSFSKTRRAELERILQSDNSDYNHPPDATTTSHVL